MLLMGEDRCQITIGEPAGVRALTYRCDGEPLVTVVCHCKDCQRQTGSAFSIFVVVPRATLHVGGDTLATYVTVGADSGEERQRQFCSKCGSPVVTLLAERPELAVIKAGTLNDPSWLSPTLEVWCGSARRGLRPSRTAGGSPAACRPDWTASVKHCAIV